MTKVICEVGKVEPPDPSYDICMTPTIFAIASEYASPASESLYLATLRLNLKGHKTCWCVKTDVVASYLQSKVDNSTTVAMKSVYTFLADMTIESAKEFVARGVIYFARLSPGSMLYLPAGWSYQEVTFKADVIGMKVQMLSA